MVTLIDTSAWVEYLRGTGSETHQRVRDFADARDYGITDIVVAELSMGAVSPTEVERVRRIADTGIFYATRPLFDYETAAEIYRACRIEGLTPRSLADCLVAAVAMNRDLELLAADRDFERMAEHVPLRLA